jgi:hypothetical protein
VLPRVGALKTRELVLIRVASLKNKGVGDSNLCRNATEYTNNHEYKDAIEITLHFINIKELKFV